MIRFKSFSVGENILFRRQLANTWRRPQSDEPVWRNQIRHQSSGDHVVPASSYISWNAKTPVKIRYSAESYPENLPPILVEKMFRDTVERYPNHSAIIGHRSENDWKLRWTYERYWEEVISAAKGFIAIGLQPSNAVGIMANNCPEWFVSSLACIISGGLTSGIHMTSSADNVFFISKHAQTDLLIFESEELLKQIQGSRSIEELFPHVKKIVLIDAKSSMQDSKVITWQQLIDLGRNETDTHLNQRRAEAAVNKACMMIYTSGTTGPPKGALISQDNITWASQISMDWYGWREGEEVLLSYLPLSHAAAHLIDVYMIMLRAGTVYVADKNALKGTLVENLKAARPTKFYGVPRVWEKIQERLLEAGSKSGQVRRAVVDWAKRAASHHHLRLRQGAIHEGEADFKMKFARKLVFSRIQDALGLDRTKETPVSMTSTGAPLSRATFDFLESIDLAITELYGCTEATGPLTTSLSGTKLRPGTVGQKFHGVNLKILKPDSRGIGEVIFRSRNTFMGYHLNEQATKEAFTQDLWFRTGDLGCFDDDGFLTITGRLKELIITAGGKNISPVPIEDRIKNCLQSVVSNVMVVGDRRKYLTCLITLKTEVDAETLLPTQVLTHEAVQWCTSQAPHSKCQVATVKDFREGKFAQDFRKAILKSIDESNNEATSTSERVKKFFILPQNFTIAGGELGPTLKLKRYAVAEKYKNEINTMYE